MRTFRTKCSDLLVYPGGKGPLLMVGILGVVVARAAEAEVPGFGPLAVWEEPAVVADGVSAAAAAAASVVAASVVAVVVIAAAAVVVAVIIVVVVDVAAAVATPESSC